MAKKSTRSTRKTKAQDLPTAVVETAMKLAAQQGWRGLSLAEIADEAKLPLSEVLPAFPSKQAVLSEFVRRIDSAVLESLDKEPLEGSARDRLFDLLMRRFDALQPYRGALANIAWDEARDPCAVACGLCRLRRSLSQMLEAAGLASDGCQGHLKLKGLAGIYLCTLRTWLKDDSEDMSKTMAALDRQLNRTENLCRRFGFDRRSAAEAA